MNAPAIQEGGCTKLPEPPGSNGPGDLADIPISVPALVSGAALFAGVLAGSLQIAHVGLGGGRLVALLALAMSIAGLTTSKTRLERTLGVVALLTTIAALSLGLL